VRLAEELAKDQAITIEPRGGVEIALRGMMAAAGLLRVAIEATHDAPRTTHVSADALTVFKALQLLRSRDMTPLARFVTFDFETTDKDVDTCGVVEIGAVRVVNGEIVERFHALVNPYLPLSPQATAVHGYTDADVADAARLPRDGHRARAGSREPGAGAAAPFRHRAASHARSLQRRARILRRDSRGRLTDARDAHRAPRRPESDGAPARAARSHAALRVGRRPVARLDRRLPGRSACGDRAAPRPRRPVLVRGRGGKRDP